MSYLNILQSINNFLFSISGLNEITLELQVYINSKRFEKNEPDLNEMIYFDNTGVYVQ